MLAQISDYDEGAQALDAAAEGALLIRDRKQTEVERYDATNLRSEAELLVTADVVVVAR